MKQCLQLDEPLDAAIFACLTTCFWCITWLGEFTVANLKVFHPMKHVTHSAMSCMHNCHGLEVIKFNLPWTKMTPSTGQGESVQCAQQEGPADPVSTLHNHLHINPGPADSHLFSWKAKDRALWPLTHNQFIKCISALAIQLNLPNIKGHSLHIESTLEYLL
ncbi:hypothetical protein ID866_7645 [Astraeus odoratus]|nr:hypothetical protein ID866_7645 [Astraeus odoratus]